MATVICHDTIFANVDAVFLDKDGTLAAVNHYLTRLAQYQAQLMTAELPGGASLILTVLGVSADGYLDPAGLMAAGSRQETVAGVAAIAVLEGLSWGEAVTLATNTLATADCQCSPKAPHTPLTAGALDFLARLGNSQLKVAIVSADTQPNLDRFVEYYQLENYVDYWQGTRPDRLCKTDPSFLHVACDAVGVEPRHVLIIGDAVTDLQMAQTAGGLIGFLGGWQPPLQPNAIAPQNLLNESAIDVAFAAQFDQIRLDCKTKN